MRNLTPELVSQVYSQDSGDPLLMLLTLSHPSFTNTIRLSNNSVDTVSRGNTYISYPFSFTLPIDDGESAREVSIKMDNVSLEIIREIRKISTPINVLIEMVVASNPNVLQLAMENLIMDNVQYNTQSITASLRMDGFLAIELLSEKYTPSKFPGIF